MIVDAKALSEIPRTATALRSQHVTEVEPALATRIEIKTRTQTFAIRKNAAGWSLSRASNRESGCHFGQFVVDQARWASDQ